MLGALRIAAAAACVRPTVNRGINAVVAESAAGAAAAVVATGTMFTPSAGAAVAMRWGVFPSAGVSSATTSGFVCTLDIASVATLRILGSRRPLPRFFLRRPEESRRLRLSPFHPSSPPEMAVVKDSRDEPVELAPPPFTAGSGAGIGLESTTAVLRPLVEIGAASSSGLTRSQRELTGLVGLPAASKPETASAVGNGEVESELFFFSL